MRKILAFVLGLACLVGGTWYLYFALFQKDEGTPSMFIAGGGFIAFIGAALIWDTLRRRGEVE